MLASLRSGGGGRGASHQSNVFRVEPVLTDTAGLHVRLLQVVRVRVGPVTAAVHPLVVVIVPVVFVYNVSVSLEATGECAELGIAAIAAEVTFAVKSLHLRPKVVPTLRKSLYAIVNREPWTVVTDLVLLVALARASETDTSLSICFALFANEDCLPVDIASWIRAQVAVIPADYVIGILQADIRSR